MNDTAQNQQLAKKQTKISVIGKMLQKKLKGSLPIAIKPSIILSKASSNSTNNNKISNNKTNNGNNNIAQKLDVFESVLNEIQANVPHGLVEAVNQVTNTLNPQGGTRSAKERIEIGKTADNTSFDNGGGVQVVEQEKNPEIPIEVESYLQRVEDHHDTAPTEIIIADGTGEISSNNYPSKPVIILPITQEEEKIGAKKSPKLSFRWLVEFSHKIIKMFTGKVIYRQEES